VPVLSVQCPKSGSKTCHKDLAGVVPRPHRRPHHAPYQGQWVNAASAGDSVVQPPVPYSLSPLSTPVSRVNPNNCHCRQSASATVSATVFSRRPKSQRIDSRVLQLEAGDGTWSWNCHSAADGACWPSNVRAKHLD